MFVFALVVATGAGAETPFSTQLHIHGSFSEGSGSMHSHSVENRDIGVDVLWWTDHDRYFTHYHDATNFSFESFEEMRWENEDWTPIKTSLLGQTKVFEPSESAGMESFDATISGLQAWEGSGSMRMSATNVDAEFDRFSYRFQAASRYRKAIPAGISLSIAIFPELVVGDARATVDIVMSVHGTETEAHELHYYLDNTPGAQPFREGNIYHLPLTYAPGAWNLYSLDLTQDAIDGFGAFLGEDNSMHSVRLGVESRLGSEAVAYFDALQIDVQHGYPELFTKQRTMLDLLEVDIPEIEHRQGCEISEEIIHINDYSVGTELPDYDWLAEVGGFLDGQGMLTDELAFRDFVTEYVVDQAHDRDGVAALAHPYGTSPDSTGGVDRQVKLDELVTLGVWGADAVEVGYRSRGGHDLPDHLWLWDELAKSERFLTGIGTTDAHGAGHIHGPNNFVTWIWADSSSKPDLIEGLKRGRAYFGDIQRFDGELSISTANGFAMGQIVVSDKSSEEITFQIDGLGGGEEVRTIWDGTLANTYVGGAGSFAQTETLPIAGATSWRVEVWDPDGTAIVFSNPIYFEPKVPTAGIGPHRAAVDVGGVNTTTVDSWTFTGVLYRDLGSRKLMKINGRGSSGTIVFDFAAIGEPTGIRFEGMTGSWSYDAGVLTLSALEGEGAIKILKRL